MSDNTSSHLPERESRTARAIAARSGQCPSGNPLAMPAPKPVPTVMTTSRALQARQAPPGHRLPRRDPIAGKPAIELEMMP